MTDLQIIAGIVARYRVKHLDIINLSGNIKRKENRFVKAYNLLFEGITPDDKSKSDFLMYKKGSVGFRSFTSRFREKLLNMLFFVDYSKTRLSTAGKAECLCSQMSHQIRLLAILSGRRPAMKLAEKMLHMAEKYKLTEYAIFATKALRKHSSEMGNNSAFKKYNEKHIFWTAQLAAEGKAIIYMEMLDVHFAKSISQKPKLAIQAFKNVSDIRLDIVKHDSFVLQYHIQKIEAIAYHISKDYTKSLEIWSAFEKYLHQNTDFASDTRYAEVALQKMDCFMHLRNYVEGKKCAETCLKYFRPESRNRLIFMEYYYLLAMQNGEYKKGNEILIEVSNRNSFDEMTETSREKWKLFEAYNIFVHGSESLQSEFHLSKFLNEFLVFNKDKRGYNVAILILNWCFLLKRGEFEILIKITDSLSEYRKRYLMGKPDFRVNLFVYMMLTANKLEYEYESVKLATNTYLRKMRLARIAYTGNMEGLEIIPLDDLWEMALADMQKKRP